MYLQNILKIKHILILLIGFTIIGKK